MANRSSRGSNRALKKTIHKVAKHRTAKNPSEQASIAFSLSTDLGKSLWLLRSRLAASGAKPMDWDEIHRELMSRRDSIAFEDE